MRLITCCALVLPLSILLGHTPARGLDRARRIQAMKSVVLVVALKRQGDKLVVHSRGSGSIISSSGLILTNNHVVSDTKTGELYDALAVGLTTAFDQAPRPTCLAFPRRAIRDPSLDLAVIKCEAEVNGQPLRRAIDWPAATVGDSSAIVPGDDLFIVGYPAIGGMTITFSAGKTSGFLDEDTLPRAWIKTDALISPGVSGGAAFDEEGQLIGVPTQLRWEQGGRTNMGLVRPAERARALLSRVTRRAWNDIPRGGTPTPDSPSGAGIRLQFGPVNVSGGLSPAQVSQTLQANLADMGQCYTTALKRNAGLTGYLDLLVSISPAGQMQGARLERSTVPDKTLVQCVGHAMVAVRFPAAAEATTGNVLLLFLGFLGPAPPPTPDPNPPDSPERKVPPRLPRIEPPPEAPTITGRSLVMGLLRDASTNQPVVGAVVLILNPGVRVNTLDRSNLAANTATTAVSSSLGYFRTARALPQGKAYGVVIAARGYKALGVDDAVKLMPGTPPVLNLGLIRLRPLGY